MCHRCAGEGAEAGVGLGWLLGRARFGELGAPGCSIGEGVGGLAAPSVRGVGLKGWPLTDGSLRLPV